MSKIQSPISDLEPIRLPRFDWDHTKDFYYVAKLGSLTRAAQFLRTSQPSLSRRMTDLETDLKCKLLHRTPRGVSLTRKGEELFQIVEQNFIALKGFGFNAAAMANGGQKRKIRISTTHPYGAYILHQPLLKFNEMNSNILFEVVTDDHFIDLIISDVDIAIRPYDDKAQDIVQEHLSSVEKKIFASQGYLDKYGEPQTIEDLLNHRIISHAQPEAHPYSDTNWILRLGKTEGKTHEPIFTSNSLELLVEAAQKGMGIMSGFREMSILQKSGLVNILKDVQGPCNRDYISYPKYLQKDDTLMLFKNYLINEFERFRKKDL